MVEIDVDVAGIHRRAAEIGHAAADLGGCVLRSSRAFAAIGAGSGDPGVLQAALMAEVRWRYALTLAAAACAALSAAGTGAAHAYERAEESALAAFGSLP